ncbi:MAG: response regulator transcription factor, partial [Firmicutes bacterium]|nr:response regulator transcription factor [Bacillota bacterium]
MYNVLICDDEKDIVSALKIYLSSENYNTYE